MPKKLRHRSKNSKSNSNSGHLIMIDESSRDLNGTSSLEKSDTLTCSLTNEISKKRSAEMTDDDESNCEDIGPPRKKRNNQDLKPSQKVPNKKRPNNTSDDELVTNKTKIAKVDNHEEHHMDFNKRIWKESISYFSNLHAQCSSENIPHFVIVTYNILLDRYINIVKNPNNLNTTDNFNYSTLHMHLMKELDFINADIICLQQVDYSYWKNTLESSLKERGFCGDIVIGDNVSNIGVATLYQTSRFTKVDIDSNKLSTLCSEQIIPNSGLDDCSISYIKQYIDEPDAYMVTVLKDNQLKNERLLIVGNTHLSNSSTEKQDLRCVQAVGIFWRIHKMISQLNSKFAENSKGEPATQPLKPCWILCGDFNSRPDSALYQICRDGYPNEHSISELQSLRKVPMGDSRESCSLVDLLWHGFQHPLTDSCSSYLQVTSSEPSKDYIWMCEGGLRAERVLMPCASQYSTTNNNRWSSTDHISLACDVAFTS